MATHYSDGDLLDRDTFMRYGPFDPVRLAISRQLEAVEAEAEEMMTEVENDAYEKGRRDRNSLADELEAEVERLKKELNNRPTYGDMLEMRSALEWIAKGNTTKADMIAAAKEALADVAQRQLEATKAY